MKLFEAVGGSNASWISSGTSGEFYMRPLGNAALYFQLRDLLVISFSLLFFLFEKDSEVCLISPDAQGGNGAFARKEKPPEKPGGFSWFNLSSYRIIYSFGMHKHWQDNQILFEHTMHKPESFMVSAKRFFVIRLEACVSLYVV